MTLSHITENDIHIMDTQFKHTMQFPLIGECVMKDNPNQLVWYTCCCSSYTSCIPYDRIDVLTICTAFIYEKQIENIVYVNYRRK